MQTGKVNNKITFPEKLLLLPLVGIASFIVLYYIATLIYPGGSQADKNSTGFSWVHNYWCDLLNEMSINGAGNVAQPVAISAMLVLCLSLSCFWYIFPDHLPANKINRAIKISGPLSMLSALLLFAEINHDLALGIATFFGMIASSGTLFGLYKLRWRKLFIFGLLNLVLIALNNYVYYNKACIQYLPFIQKISFASFLIWIFCIDIVLYLKLKSESSPAGN